MMLSPIISKSQSRKYPIVRTEGRDTVVVMTVKQADAINLKFSKMKIEVDSLLRVIENMNKALNESVRMRKMDERILRDSLLLSYQKMAEGPTFIYNYKGEIYALNMGLFKIKMRTTGKIKLKKMTKRQIGKYIELIRRDYDNSIDWKSEFWDFELPVLDENKQIGY